MKNIHTIKKNKKQDIVEPSQAKTVFFTIRGKHDVVDEYDNPIIIEPKKIDAICAKLMVDGDHKQFFIRRDGDGSFYNPHGLYAEGYLTRSGRRVSKPELDFRRVTENVFNLYLQFLRTKNESWLRNAERQAM